MKKMLLIIAVIIAITIVFLLFSSDTDILNRRFLLNFGIETDKNAVTVQEITIPEEFDSVYENYNVVQLEAGFDLSGFKGKKAVRYTYKMLNFPNGERENIYANVLVVNHKPIGGDICCTDIDGFILPLNFLKTNKFD